MGKDQPKQNPLAAKQDELSDLLGDEAPAVSAAPPNPRAPGKTVTANDEDKALAQIAEENKQDALDDLYEHEREPEAPMLVIGDEKRRWYHFLKRPKFWFSFIGLLIAVFLLAWLITPSRLWMLNTVGLRAQVEIATLVGSVDGTPPILKNALVTINGHEYHTDDKGRLAVSLPYGNIRVVVSKPGYETVTKDQTVDFDPFFHYLGGEQADHDIANQTFIMKSVGIPINFIAKDWLTGLPITTGHYGIGDVVTTPDAKGEVSLLIPATDEKVVKVAATFDAGGYADTTVDYSIADKPTELTFVPAGKHYFISKRSGQFAVYSSNIDGTAITEIVPGSANETGDVALSVSPSGKYAVLASTREATRDTFASVQQKLYVVDFSNNKLTPLDTALTFTVADWSGDTVVYTANYRNTSGAVVERVASIDAAKSKQTTIATDPDFAVVRVRLNSVVYVRADKELKTAKLDGANEKSLGTGIGKITQTNANTFAYQVADKTWRQYDVNADQVATVATPAAQDRAFLASTSGDGQNMLVADKIDGVRTLIVKSVGNGNETKVFSGDFTGPVRWIGNVAVYRVGTADYAVGPTGGTAKKISDVSATQTAANDYFNFN